MKPSVFLAGATFAFACGCVAPSATVPKHPQWDSELAARAAIEKVFSEEHGVAQVQARLASLGAKIGEPTSEHQLVAVLFLTSGPGHRGLVILCQATPTGDVTWRSIELVGTTH